MTESSDRTERELLQLIDAALELADTKSAESWLLDRLPASEHARASRMLGAAKLPTSQHNQLSAAIFDHTAQNWIGRRVGAYQLRALLGEGGMGQVFVAGRVDGEFEQEVAVKIIRAASLTSSAISQFLSERQILAQLRHPNISGLLDGGTTEDGLPFVVMELVDGESLDVYLSRHSLSLHDRVRLFVQICGAVEHAHRSLVIHRDIKPSNILVTKEGVPKLLDFSIAKSLGAMEDANTVGGRLLTPSYASPEQVTGDVLTTATDVYSLGVLLYQCLTGERPYETDTLSPAEYQQVVTEEVPDKPSERVKKIGEGDSGALEGDLDAIVMRALAKEPERRYPSAAAFADDLDRFLGHMPVTARPDTAFYRLQRFVRRRRSWVVSGTLMTIALLGAFATTHYQYRVAVSERDRADARFEQARGLARSVFYDVYDNLADVQGTLAVRESLADIGVSYLDELSSDPKASDSLRLDLGKHYTRLSDVYGGIGIANLGKADESFAQLEKAQGLLDGILQRNPTNLAALTERLWVARLKTNQYLFYKQNVPAAREEITSIMAMADRVRHAAASIDWPLESRYWNARTDYIKVLLADNDHTTALSQLNVFLEEIDAPELEPLVKREGKRVYFVSQRAELNLDAGRYADSLNDWLAALEFNKKLYEERPEVSYFMIQLMRINQSLGKAYNGLEQHSEALIYADAGLELANRLLALEENDVSSIRNRVTLLEVKAGALIGLGNRVAAAKLLDETRQVYEGLLAADLQSANLRSDRANILFLQGQLAATSDLAKGCALLREAQSQWEALATEKKLTASDRAARFAQVGQALKEHCLAGSH